MKGHAHLAQFMRTKHKTVDEYVHLWRCIDIASSTVPDSRGSAPLLVTGSGTGSFSTIDGDSAFTGTDGPIRLLYDDLDIDLRAGGEDYTLIIASAYQSYKYIPYSDDSKGLSFYPYTENGAKVYYNTGGVANRGGIHDGPNKKTLFAYTREGAYEIFYGIKSGSDYTRFVHSVSSPPVESSTLLFGSHDITAPGAGIYWIAISGDVKTTEELMQAYVDGRPPA